MIGIRPVNSIRDWSWRVLLACVALTAAASTATSLTLRSLPLTYDSFVIPKLAAMGVLTAVALVLWATGGDRAVRWHVGASVMAVTLGLATLSTVFGLDPAVALFGRDAANGLLAYLCYGAVFFLIVQSVTGVGRIVRLTRALVGGAVLVSLASLFQAIVIQPEYLDSIGLDRVGYLYGRGGGLLGNPDYVGAYLVVPLILALTLALSERTSLWRNLAIGGSVLIGLALAVTQVRAGWVGLGAGALTFALLMRKSGASVPPRMKWVALAATAAVAAVGLGATDAWSRFGSLAQGGLDALSGGRLSVWQDALQVAADRPLLGTGPDSFTLGWYRQATALADPVSGVATYFEDPHNFYLTIMTTMGIPALIALVALIVIAVRSGLATRRLAANSPAASVLSAGWLSAFVGLLATLLFAVTTIPSTLLFFVCAAVLVAPTARSVELEPLGAGFTRGAAGLVAVVCLAALIPLTADYHLGQYMRTRSAQSLDAARSTAPWEKTIQLQYLSSLTEEVVPLIQAGDSDAVDAVTAFDNEAFILVMNHPHELQYALRRIDLLGRAGSLGGDNAEKALTVIDLTLDEYPNLTDLKVSKARVLNNLERSEESRELLEPMAPSVLRDTALVETLLLLKDETAARSLIEQIVEDYPQSAYAQAFLAQPSVAPYVNK